MITFSGRRASQSDYELGCLIELFKLRGVRSYLEVGARHGDTFHAVMSALPKGSLGVAVDLGGGAWGTPKSVKHLNNVINDLNTKGYDCIQYIGDSTSQTIIDCVKSYGKFDACFIDGDHRYEGVRADWENYGNARGINADIVAFHDINGEGQKDGDNNPVEVPKLWREITSQYNTQEFIDDKYKMGIGVVIA